MIIQQSSLECLSRFFIFYKSNWKGLFVRWHVWRDLWRFIFKYSNECKTLSQLYWIKEIFKKQKMQFDKKRAYFAWMVMWWKSAFQWRSSHCTCYLCVNGDKLSAALNWIWCLWICSELMSIYISLYRRVFVKSYYKNVSTVLCIQNMLIACRYKFAFKSQCISSKSTTRPLLKDYLTKVFFF